MDLYCPVCGELLGVLEAKFTGQFSHCGKAFRFSHLTSEEGEPMSIDLWEHSRNAYNPANIWADPVMPMVHKEAKLKALYSFLKNLEYDFRQVVIVNMNRCPDFLKKASASLNSAAVADSIAKPESTFDTVKIRWSDKKAVNEMWQSILLMWAKANGSEPIHVYEEQLIDIVSCVRFARNNGLDVPDHLRLIKT